MPARRASKPRNARRPKRRASTPPAPPRFVGRDASPVLERYPPKDPALAPRGPPPARPTVPKPAAPGAPTPAPSAPNSTLSAPPSQPLITLDRPFDVDEFSSLLGETSIRITVPREALPEVLRRVTEFMGFGIYVYALTVRPAPAELLKSFVVELQRVDYSSEKGAWVPFVEKGTVNSPYGSGGPPT
jgi:hypothetical protein